MAAAVVDNEAIEREAKGQCALQNAAAQRELEASNVRAEQVALTQQRTHRLAEEQQRTVTRRLAEERLRIHRLAEEQQTELMRAMQNVRVSHSTYSPDRPHSFGSSFSNVGSNNETYTGKESGFTYSTSGPVPEPATTATACIGGRIAQKAISDR